MDIATWLRSATVRLQQVGIESARLDALLLLEDITGHDRSWLLAHLEKHLTEVQRTLLNKALARRRTHEPLAYIRGKVEFYRRDFVVNEHVLVPRPETETMIELLLAQPGAATADIIDVGTGSGALAITAKLELPTAHVTAVDIDEACLDVARQNTEKLRADITVVLSDLLNNIFMQQKTSANPVILLCNLPYVPENYAINEAARHEPELALFGGDDGLDHYRALFTQAAALPHADCTIMTESLRTQHGALVEIARNAGFELATGDSLIQVYVRAS